MYNVAQLFIGAVEQKNKNVISLQILVSQLPQAKDKWKYTLKSAVFYDSAF